MQEHRQIFTVVVFCSYFLYFIFLNVLSSGGSRGQPHPPPHLTEGMDSPLLSL